MPNIPDKLQQTLDVLRFFEDRADRIQYLIDVADRFRGVPQSVATRPYPEERKVPGCESEVYIWALPQPDGTLRFHFAVENPQGVSAMALAVILEDTLSGAPLDRVAAVGGDLIYEIFGRELSMGKSTGLIGMVQMCRAAAQQAA